MTRRARGVLVAAGMTVLFSSSFGLMVFDQIRDEALRSSVAGAFNRSLPGAEQAAVSEADSYSSYHITAGAGVPWKDELLWLARCIYSETKRPIEQLLVAWVVRNRVETQYNGNGSYKEVVLDPYQFSAFNPGSNYTYPDVDSNSPGWKNALDMARYVMNAPTGDRPFSVITRHFYSERSMRNRKRPAWVGQNRALHLKSHGVDQWRFRFYSGIL